MRTRELQQIARVLQRAADDVRRWDLSITTAGEDALKQAAPAFGQVNNAIEAALSPNEIAELARMLNAIAEAGKAAD